MDMAIISCEEVSKSLIKHQGLFEDTFKTTIIEEIKRQNPHRDYYDIKIYNFEYEFINSLDKSETESIFEYKVYFRIKGNDDFDLEDDWFDYDLEQDLDDYDLKHDSDDVADNKNDKGSFTIELLVKHWKEIKGQPLEIAIIKLDNKIVNICFPVEYKSVDQYIALIEKKLQKYNLAINDIKTLDEFATFKFNSMICPTKHPEARKTYYNMLIFGDDIDNVDSFALDMIGSMSISQNGIMISDEKELIKIYGRNGINACFDNHDVIYIKNCQEKPFVNEDAGSGSARDKSAQLAEQYEQFWKETANYSKENPSVTIIVGMSEYVCKNTFKANNELYHRIFGHRIYVPEMTIELVIDLCLDEFKRSSFELSDSFLDEMEKYIRTIYKRADLKGFPFAKDAINRVYSYYFRKNREIEKLDVDCIPPYSSELKSAEDVIAQLNNLVGLKRVKETFKIIYKKQVADPENAKKEPHHMMFYGNPGTGKTTVARYTAELLCQAGFLKTNKYTECNVGDLVSAFKGNTAQKVKSKIRDSLDGVLFIDEAYGLANGNDHTQEALNILIQEMLNYQDRLVVILAGYEDKMEELMKENEGLSSRIAHKVHFDDYSIEELKEIFYLKCKDIGFSIDSSAEQTLEECLNARKLQDFFGNGRDVANLVSELQGAWSAEVFEESKNNPNTKSNVPRVFYSKHFVDLMPPKNEPSIEDMIGLDTVKKTLNEFRAQVKYLHAIKEMGMNKIPETFMHMLFVGNPGTGKTTVAKMIANDLYSLGVLKTNRLVVAERKDIISPYNGETSKQINELIRKSVGGVLFIDEAYSLADAGKDGAEVLEVLLTAMVDHKEDTVFIFAGYPKPMEKFLNINPGLQSRLGYTFIFPNYQVDELMQIFEKQMNEAGFVVSEDVLTKTRDIMDFFIDMPAFGNGRFVENVVSKIIFKRAERDYTKENYNIIDGCDVPEIGEMIESNPSGRRFLDPKKVTEDDRMRTLYHELGHAIAMYALAPNIEIISVNAKNRTQSLGRVSYNYINYRNQTEEELKNEIIIALAGRSAERVFFGTCDEGCKTDYENSKEIADKMINEYGMCDIGLTTVNDLIRQGDKDATKLIQKYQRCIESVASELIKGEEFTGEDFKKYVDEYLKNNN